MLMAGVTLPPLIICHLTKFFLVGKEFFAALQAKFLPNSEWLGSKLPATVGLAKWYQIVLAVSSGIAPAEICNPT